MTTGVNEEIGNGMCATMWNQIINGVCDSSYEPADNGMCDSHPYVRSACDAGIAVANYFSKKIGDIGQALSGMKIPEINIQETTNNYILNPLKTKVIDPIGEMIGKIDLDAAKAFLANYGINDDVITDVRGFNPSALGVDVTTARLSMAAAAIAATVVAVRALAPSAPKNNNPVAHRLI